MIHNQISGHTKPSNNMIEHEQGYSFGVIGIGRHSLCLFGKEVNDHNNVIMTDDKRGFTGGKIDTPFGKRTN